MRRLERAYVVLVAAHSYAIGLALLFLTAWGARIGGFGEVQPLFFPRQAGAFHLVVASAYLIEYFRYGGVAILLTTKSIAVAFLGILSLLGGVPWVVPVSGVLDGAMGLVAWELHRRAEAEPPERLSASTRARPLAGQQPPAGDKRTAGERRPAAGARP